MCGRFALFALASDLAEMFGAAAPEGVAPRYNIAPTQPVIAVRTVPGNGAREIVRLRWGLIPSWAKDPSIGARLINARGETISEKPAFKSAFRRRRCLIPANGFYEWAKSGRTKRPYYIGRRDEDPLAVAGLWERWAPEGAPPIESCAIITTAANDLLAPVHDRMPVILSRGLFDAWLDPAVDDPGRLASLLAPCPSEDLEIFPVGLLVNNPRVDEPRLISRLS